MTTSYPGGIDNFTNPTSTDTLSSSTVPHASEHANANDAIKAIETELGTNPKGSYASVSARLAASTGSITTWRKAASGGETSLTGTDDFSTTLAYTVGQEQVFINGVLLERGVDYTATTGSSITGLTALVASDIATVISVGTFNVANAIPLSQFTAKGDILVGTGASTEAALNIGADGTTLVANSSASTGVSWAGPSVMAGKNRIINGAMEIDQRNSGASFTPADNTYGLDRFVYGATQASKTTCQRQSSVVPNGFAYAMKVTSTSAYSITSTDEFEWMTRMEGSTVADFAWGTSDAKTVTLSFWVNSSLTGTFGGSFNNQAHNRSYAFSYTINNANTWEKKSITVAGDTTGTWINDTSGYAIELLFSLGAGSARVGTAGSWGSTFLRGVTGQVNLVANNAATWYITGIQLELGSVATAFSRAGGTLQGELQACQRYLPAITGTSEGYVGYAYGTNSVIYAIPFPTQARVAPIGMTLVTGFTAAGYGLNTSYTITNLTFNGATLESATVYSNSGVTITAGQGSRLSINGTILFTGCEL